MHVDDRCAMCVCVCVCVCVFDCRRNSLTRLSHSEGSVPFSRKYVVGTSNLVNYRAPWCVHIYNNMYHVQYATNGRMRVNIRVCAWLKFNSIWFNTKIIYRLRSRFPGSAVSRRQRVAEIWYHHTTKAVQWSYLILLFYVRISMSATEVQNNIEPAYFSLIT